MLEESINASLIADRVEYLFFLHMLQESIFAYGLELGLCSAIRTKKKGLLLLALTEYLPVISCASCRETHHRACKRRVYLCKSKQFAFQLFQSHPLLLYTCCSFSTSRAAQGAIMHNVKHSVVKRIVTTVITVLRVPRHCHCHTIRRHERTASTCIYIYVHMSM
jgi:hypothetical protein